jgi:hypothetical protein
VNDAANHALNDAANYAALEHDATAQQSGGHPGQTDAVAVFARGFAAAYLTVDEDMPARRAHALAPYLPGHPLADLPLLGWSGHGRQHADFAVVGETVPDGPRSIVDARVRITEYARRDGHWQPARQWWARLGVAVRHTGGQLTIDPDTLPAPGEIPPPKPTVPEPTVPEPSVPDPAPNEGSVIGSARAECSPADRAAGPAPLGVWAPPTSPTLPAPDLLTQVRQAAHQAVTLYAVPPGSADSSDDHADDNSAAGRTAAASHGRTTRLVRLAGAAVGGRDQAVAARAVLAELEQLVRDQPPRGGQALRYELERIRAGSHELTELDLVDALRVGQLRVPEAHRDPALRVLGGYGVDPRTRLWLPADAHPARLAAAAAAQREHWHRLATHPAATTHLHTVATAATHTCGQLLLSTAAAASSGADAPSGAPCRPSAPQVAAPVAQPQRPTRGAAPERTES